ncbi:chloride channel-like protein 3 [Aulographum hederae CBS 113979]|uniref:Chloride channel protein n=1 Tax=Aulographum hederae CBS 113979 TaxID=1176131 RepID=A0A6G1GUM0_9PEZI|nr:chloride channel-like protein 3 [Aulographum hederae CBS 113979]
MPANSDQATERTSLLFNAVNGRRLSVLQQDEEAHSIVNSGVTKDEAAMAGSTVGERLKYNDYTTIDWLHDLVKDSYRFRHVHSRKGIRNAIKAAFDSCSGWIAVTIMGAITACVAFIVDVCVATVSDWKEGYCRSNPFLSKEQCYRKAGQEHEDTAFKLWADDYWTRFAIYVAFALLFGIISSSATLLTKASLPAVPPANGTKDIDESQNAAGKTMYMAAGSGIPEIKTILSGFVIPNFLDLKVLVVKAFGAIFAVSTGMCLGKEGPFVHISTCVGYLVAKWFPKYRDNGRKMREILSAACASGLSVAFGAPIGGVLFSYEEISTYFPRKVLWRAFLCSLVAAMILKALNPTGTGKLVLFETNYGTSYDPVHYLVFIFLGIVGGIFGGTFCRINYKWGKWFRGFPIIKKNPVLEVALVVLATALLQFPNPLIREPGDIIIKNLLVDCRGPKAAETWVCRNEARDDGHGAYVGWLIYGTLAKLVLTIITFGCKVPSGVIIPALDAGALFGRLIGQSIGNISPGIFAMVGAAAFLAGVCRMTISLCVIMFELTGELEYIIPHMIAILVAKWVADSLGREGVYDLAQNVLGHPFLDLDHAISLIQIQPEPLLVEVLIPPKQTMDEITVHVPKSNKVPRHVLQKKLEQLHARGLMDAGLVLVQAQGTSSTDVLQGYLAEGELEFGLTQVGAVYEEDAPVRLLGDADEGDFDLSMFVDRTPPTVCAKAPVEYLVEMFGKLGLRYICVTEEGTGKLVGVVIKKRLVAWLETLHD